MKKRIAFIAITFFIALVIFLCIALPSFNHSHYVVGSPDALTYPPPSISNSNKGLISESVMDIINTKGDTIVEIYLAPINEYDV